MGPSVRSLLLLLSACCCALRAAVFPEPCSRALSREAAQAAGALLRAAAAAGVAPAPACPLQPHLSRYAAHEAAKARKKDKHWVCQACGRSFSGEAWVDEHLRARHSGGGGGGALRALPLAGLCLADHCGMLGCPGLRGGAAAPPPRDAPEAPQRCLAVLAECFPEAAALAEEAAQGSGGASDASDAAAAARRAFYEQQRAALCASTPEQRERAWEAEAAALRAFKWTPLRAGSAAAGALLFLWLLRLIVLEDVRNPIKGVKARAREREAAAAAAAAARKQPGREREAAAPGAAEARRAEVAAAAREVAAAREEAAREVAAAREEAAREEAAGGAGGSGGGAGGSGGLRFRG